jgi:subtilisin
MTVTMNTPQRFIILPPRGTSGAAHPAAASLLLSMNNVLHGSAAATRGALKNKVPMKVVDSIHENGPKLVEMSVEGAAALRAAEPGVRVVPEVFYTPARAPIPKVATRFKPKAGAAAALRTPVKVVSRATGSPVPGAQVVAFTDFASRTGDGQTTTTSGTASLRLPPGTKLDRLYVIPADGFWPLLLRNVKLTNSLTLQLRPIAFDFTDALRFFHKNPDLTQGQGVTVGVIDTGVGPHKHLIVAGGRNTVEGEQEADFQNNGEGHGTHVAGIIASRGLAPDGVRGVAPGVTLRSYRVFGKGAEGASNFAITKAIVRAMEDGCDIVNLSLGGGDADEATHSAIVDARAAGMLAFAATGNDGRQPVSFPGADATAVAVSALGRKGTFPTDAAEVGDQAAPFGTDKQDFIAAFSNVGPEVDLTGPGVGIISTFPGDLWAVLDGTSMACPAVVGAAAAILAAQPAVLAMPRLQARSDAMLKAVFAKALDLGFPATLEGSGRLDI